MCNWESLKAITGDSSNYILDNGYSIKTTVKAGARELENIFLRRIPLRYLPWSKEGDFPGHYWLEIKHENEDKIDTFTVNAREQRMCEKDIINSGTMATEHNGYRESYGWYPAVNLPVKLWYRPVRALGVLNGESSKRKKKDSKKYLTHEDDRKAGRQAMNNELSTVAFDPHQKSRFHTGEIKSTTHPYLLPDDTRTQTQVIQEIRDFAGRFFTDFSQEWSWTSDGSSEVNCHTFLFLLLSEVKLVDPFLNGTEDEHFQKYYSAINSDPSSDPKFKKLINDLAKRTYRLYDFLP